MPASTKMTFPEKEPMLRQLIADLPRTQRTVLQYMIRKGEWVMGERALVFSNKTDLTGALSLFGYDYQMVSRALLELEKQDLIVPLAEQNPLRWRIL